MSMLSRTQIHQIIANVKNVRTDRIITAISALKELKNANIADEDELKLLETFEKEITTRKL